MAETDVALETHRAQLVEAMGFLTDALAFAVGPTGELIYIPDDMRVQLAWHLARTGAGCVKGQAVVKRQAVPDRPGQMAGSIAWVPVDAEDPDPTRTADLSAQGVPVDARDLDDSLPWHVKTKIEGDFR